MTSYVTMTRPEQFVHPIRLSPQVASQDLMKLTVQELSKLWRQLKRIDPHRCQKLSPHKLGLFKCAIRRDLRVIFRIEADGAILILHIDRRNDVYRFVGKYKPSSHYTGIPLEEIEIMSMSRKMSPQPVPAIEHTPESTLEAIPSVDVEKEDAELIALSFGSLIGRKMATVDKRLKDEVASCLSLVNEVEEVQVKRHEALTARCDVMERKQDRDHSGLASKVEGLELVLSGHVRYNANTRQMNDLRFEKHEECLETIAEDLAGVKTVVTENTTAIVDAVNGFNDIRTGIESQLGAVLEAQKVTEQIALANGDHIREELRVVLKEGTERISRFEETTDERFRAMAATLVERWHQIIDELESTKTKHGAQIACINQTLRLTEEGVKRSHEEIKRVLNGLNGRVVAEAAVVTQLKGHVEEFTLKLAEECVQTSLLVQRMHGLERALECLQNRPGRLDGLFAHVKAVVRGLRISRRGHVSGGSGEGHPSRV